MNQLSTGDDIMIGLTTKGGIETIIFTNQQSGHNVWTEIPSNNL